MNVTTTRPIRTIDDPPYPLCFKAGHDGPTGPESQWSNGERLVRFDARVLSHMQKEGVVAGAGKAMWRLTSDEGPLMRATDLAPAPLPLFSAGMQFCFLQRLHQFCGAHRVGLRSVDVNLQNTYSLTGSFTRGDVMGDAYPARLHVDLQADGDPALVGCIVQASVATSIAELYFRTPLLNTFSLYLNGRVVAAARRRNEALPEPEDPNPRLNQLLASGPVGAVRKDILTKLAAAADMPPASGETAPNLRAEQNRKIEVRGTSRLADSGHIASARTGLHPNGSIFRYLANLPGAPAAPADAPSAADYVAAAIGFCFMTQLHRFIAVTHVPVDEVRLLQFSPYKESGAPENWSLGVSLGPIDTNVFIEGRATIDQVISMLSVSQKTCFLHRALHSALPSVVSATLNGRNLDLPS